MVECFGVREAGQQRQRWEGGLGLLESRERPILGIWDQSPILTQGYFRKLTGKDYLLHGSSPSVWEP